MKRLVTGLAPAVLMIALFLLAAPANAAPLSSKATVNLSMPYYLEVDIANQHVTAYKTDSDEMVRRMICSTGKSSRSTPRGTFRLQSNNVYSWYKFETCYIRYGKRVTGRIWLHSILYSRRNTGSLIKHSFNNLGAPASAGCIRLTPIDAQWISYNCNKGTTVRIISGTKTLESRAVTAQLKSELQSAGHSGVQPVLTPTPMPTLYMGSNNSRVKSMHQRLRSLGFYPGAVNTLFTQETKSAVEAYQQAAGLEVTGEADSALQRKIEKDDSITGQRTTLRYGNKFIAVKALQRQLKSLGYMKANAKLSTTYNAATRTAVRAFQSLAGLTVDGIATPRLQQLLFSAAAPTPTPTPTPVYAGTTRRIPLRKNRSNASTRLTYIPANRQVVVLAKNGGWTKVTYGSKTGFVQTKYLK
jgi:peptidoglycan hydrolase-like protein with peptidoglycan-binding domain